jgi:5S rRNA maturation endonuclease (ribonuclease M5)
MHLINTHDPLVITEGQFDTLALIEAGIQNVVSVPSGSNDFSWIDNCWDWLLKFNKIILFGDNDAPGQKMITEVIKRLGEERCYTVVNDTKGKDANEILVYYGVDKLHDMINNAKEIPIDGLLNLNNCGDLNYENMLRIPTGFQKLDSQIGGSMMGDISVWTGSNGSGKSTIVGQVMIHAVSQGYNVCAYSGELSTTRYKYWIDLQTAGKSNIGFKFDKIKQKDVPYLEPQILSQIKEFRGTKWHIYDSFLTAESENIFRVFKYFH